MPETVVVVRYFEAKIRLPGDAWGRILEVSYPRRTENRLEL
jgi:hypothetical protein